MGAYCVHGLSIESDIALPPLTMNSEAFSIADVSVSQGWVPHSLQNPEIQREFYQVASGEALMRAPGVGRMYITQGKKITYTLDEPSRGRDLAAHILGSGCTIVHQQRSNVVLHAASVCLDDQVVLICGASGAGKSTNVAHMLKAGAHTLGDDVCFVGQSPEFLIHPGPPSTKLSEGELGTLTELRDLPDIGLCPSGKTIIGTWDRFISKALRLAGIVVIDLIASDGPVATRQLTQTEGVATLHRNSFRKRFISADNAPTLFAKWSQIAQAIPMWQITRPEGQDTRANVLEMLEELIQKKKPAVPGSAITGAN